MSEWPDFEIPETWSLTPIEELAETLRAGGTPSRKNKAYFGGDIPFAIIEDITGCGTYLDSTKQAITRQGLEASSAWIVPEGSVLLSMYATIGATAINTIPVATNQAILAIVPKETCHPEFLCYCLQAHKRHLAQLNVESTQKNVNKGIVSSFRLPLPPLQEQKSIANILLAVRRAIDAQERIIQATTELKQTLIHKLFSEGLRGEPQKETEIGLVPESWEVVELVSILREPLRNGHSAKAISDENGIRTLTLTAVTQQDFSIENTKATCANPQRVREMWLKPGDIFIERANTSEYVGLAALYEGVEDFAIFPDLLIRIRVDNAKMRPKVLIEWLLAETCRRYYKKNARSTAGNFPKIDQGTVEKTLVPVPSPEEQKELEHTFRTLDDKLREHASHKSALQDLFHALLHEMMTAKTRAHELEISV